MKTLSSILAFIDLLFNMLLCFTALFIISFMFINPPQENGQLDPPVKLLVTMEWDNESKIDIDLWIRNPTNTWVGFSNKDAGYMSLERDDTGVNSDVFYVDGIKHEVKRNYEVITFSTLPEGEYIVNAHYWSVLSGKPQPENVKITIIQLNPYKEIIKREISMISNQENTFVSFEVNADGEIIDLRQDIEILYAKLRRQNSGGPLGGYNEW